MNSTHCRMHLDRLREILRARNIVFILLSLIGIFIYYPMIRSIIMLSFQKELYSHVLVVPMISGYFFFLSREYIFSDLTYSILPGSVLMIGGALLYLVGLNQRLVLNADDYLSITMISALAFWFGSFIFLYGGRSFRKVFFPFLFLVFMVPIPSLVLEVIVHVFQRGSSEAAYVLFKLTGVPFLREGLTFHLKELSVEVAEQCSGIRSSLVLFIISVLAGHIFLRTGWRKIALSVSVFPIAIFKNGVRIVTLSLLGAYVDERILSSALHRRGGIPFFVIALIIWAPILWALRKSEKKELTEKSCLKHLDYNS